MGKGKKKKKSAMMDSLWSEPPVSCSSWATIWPTGLKDYCREQLHWLITENAKPACQGPTLLWISCEFRNGKKIFFLGLELRMLLSFNIVAYKYKLDQNRTAVVLVLRTEPQQMALEVQFGPDFTPHAFLMESNLSELGTAWEFLS